MLLNNCFIPKKGFGHSTHHHMHRYRTVFALLFSMKVIEWRFKVAFIFVGSNVTMNKNFPVMNSESGSYHKRAI